MNTDERKARQRAAEILRTEFERRVQHGWSRMSAAEALDVTTGGDAGSEVEREAWRLIGDMRERATTGGYMATWLNGRLAERAGQWERDAAAPAGGELTAAEKREQQRIATRETLTLDPEMDAALHTIVARIVPVIETADLTLGGGTVLAMRYHHRRSFDLDVFYPITLAPDIYTKHGRGVWQKHLGELLTQEDEEIPNALACAGTCEGVRFSVSPATDTRATESTQPIAGHKVAAQATKQIMEGKVLGRLANEEQEVMIRDLYDISIAGRLEPQVTRLVLGKLWRDAGIRASITRRLANARDDLYLRDPQPIVAPRYEIELHGLARALLPLFESGDPLLAPSAKPQDEGVATVGRRRE